MALRVLLADECPSIKKAFELALQDYGVKIQIVHQGVDIKELFHSFSPDICFMDILLPKLNGYEACTELKTSESSKDIPVVLMWSGFMELDKEKYKASLADGDIEKPFDTNTLRSLVKSLVPRLSSNELSNHITMDQQMIGGEDNNVEEFPPKTPSLKVSALDLPDLPDFGDFDSEGEDTDVTGLDLDIKPLSDSPQTSSINVDISAKSDSLENFSTPDFDDLLKDDRLDGDSLNDDISDDFSAPEGLDFNLSDSTDEDWEEQQSVQEDFAPEGLDDVDSFSVKSLSVSESDDLPFETPDDFSDDDDIFAVPEDLNIDLPPTPDQTVTPVKTQEANVHEDSVAAPLDVASEPAVQELQPLKNEESSNIPPLKSNEEVPVTAQVPPQLSKEELKRLILAQSKDIIESVVWDVVPELAKEMIQKEIQRLTGEVKFNGDLR